jgi:FkbH-like protein
MRYFIFRNNTIEAFFGDKGVAYSGYDDVSMVPKDAEQYIWFYQVPFKTYSSALSAEIDTYFGKFQMVYNQIGADKTFIVFTLENLFPIKLTNSDFSVEKSLEKFNSDIIAFAEKHSNVKVVDFKEFLNRYSLDELVNWKFYFISQMQLNPKLTADFQKWFKRKEAEIQLKRKKCLVLDLDNTLWGGILGEDGIDGIKIGGDYPGKAFLYWQEDLLELSKSGVILTICSKNNEKDVLEAWEKNPFMVLKKDNFSAYRINWNDKATNLQGLARELNIGLDSFVFIDDNPTERELIKQVLPMVSVPDFPEKPYELPKFFKQLVSEYFCVYKITEEDKNKTAQYKANAERAAEQAKFVNFEDYLKSLNIEIDILKADNFNKERIAQMTQKTNQFNLTTRRYTDADVQQKIDGGWKIYCISVRDKFGDNGITGTIFFTPKDENNTVEIDSLLLSCRILGKGIEMAFIHSLLNTLTEDGVRKVKASYIPTAKNAQVSDFYDRAGFKFLNESSGVKSYSVDLSDKIEIKEYYKINYK